MGISQRENIYSSFLLTVPGYCSKVDLVSTGFNI